MGYRATRFKLIGNLWYRRLFGGTGSTVVVRSKCPIISSVSDVNPSRGSTVTIRGFNLHNVNVVTLDSISCAIGNFSPNTLEIIIPANFPNTSGPYALNLYSSECDDPVATDITSVSPTCPIINSASFAINTTVNRNVLVTFTGTNMNNTTQVFLGNFEITNFTKTNTTVSFTTPNTLTLQRNIFAFLYGVGSNCRINNTVAGNNSTFGPFTTANV
jgi:hypothetical protein